MDTANLKTTTQGGLREEESLRASARCPAYSGGGANRNIDNNDDLGKKMDTDTNTEAMREARVVLTRYDKGGDSDSSCTSMVTVTGSPDMLVDGRVWRKRLRSCEARSGEGSGSGSEDVLEAPALKVTASRKGRGRGRTPNAGKAAFLKDRPETEQKKDEQPVERKKTVKASVAGRMSSASEGEELSSDLSRKAMASLATINDVAVKSGNLKGTFQRALKEAVITIKNVVEDLHQRSSTDETRRLQVANSRLRDEVEELRREVVELRREMLMARASASLPAPTGTTLESPAQRGPEGELEQAIMRQVGGMVNARLEALEERLLPEKRVRPPLAADRKNTATKKVVAAIASSSRSDPPRKAAATASVPNSEEPTPDNGKGKRGKKEKKTKSSSQSATATVSGSQQPRPSPTVPAGDSWATVVKRGRNKKTRAITTQASQQRQQGQAAPRPAKQDVPKLRAPRSSAVVITIQPGGVEKGMSYEEALSEAKRKVDLTQLGITSLKFRKAITGGRVFEVPGGTSSDKADSLAAKLREVYNPDDIRVSRPTKCADLRITGLDDSVSKEEVVAAIARVGECQAVLIRAGEIRRSSTGVGTTFVRCPVTAAKKLTSGGRLLVGWVSAQVKLLTPRPLQCFHCLEIGHVRAQCNGDTDRSNQCYRCGQPGHKAIECSAEPHCTVCAAANKPAGHRVGSKACKALAPKQKVRKAAAEAKTQRQPTHLPSQDELSQMDAE